MIKSIIAIMPLLTYASPHFLYKNGDDTTLCFSLFSFKIIQINKVKVNNKIKVERLPNHCI